MNSDYDIESTEHLLQELKKIKLNPKALHAFQEQYTPCLLYTSPSPRDPKTSRMPSSA